MTCQLDFRIQEIRARVNSLNFDHDVDRDAIFFPNNDEKHLREVIGKKANVAGVYIVYGKNNDQTQEHLLYIGKKIKGNEYFRMVLNGEISGVGQWDVLRIKWIETYRKPEGIPPFLAEAQLLAAYLSDTGKLPPLNQKA
jgi:hypothetical protein